MESFQTASSYEDSWVCVKELRAQLEELPAGQWRGNLTTNKDNNCHGVKWIKDVWIRDFTVTDALPPCPHTKKT